MKALSSVIAVTAVWGGFHLFSQHHAMNQVLASSDDNGFVEVPAPVDQDANTIYVVAAQNCPHAAAQQAVYFEMKAG